MKQLSISTLYPKTKFKKESTIIDVTKNKIKILRKGYLNKKNLVNCQINNEN